MKVRFVCKERLWCGIFAVSNALHYDHSYPLCDIIHLKHRIFYRVFRIAIYCTGRTFLPCFLFLILTWIKPGMILNDLINHNNLNVREYHHPSPFLHERHEKVHHNSVRKSKYLENCFCSCAVFACFVCQGGAQEFTQSIQRKWLVQL